jgi:copper chaperone CopZ
VTPNSHTYAVAGMTCDHCVMSVREEVGESCSDAQVATAVAGAGYEVAAAAAPEEALA